MRNFGIEEKSIGGFFILEGEIVMLWSLNDQLHVFLYDLYGLPSMNKQHIKK